MQRSHAMISLELIENLRITISSNLAFLARVSSLKQPNILAKTDWKPPLLRKKLRRIVSRRFSSFFESKHRKPAHTGTEKKMRKRKQTPKTGAHERKKEKTYFFFSNNDKSRRRQKFS